MKVRAALLGGLLGALVGGSALAEEADAPTRRDDAPASSSEPASSDRVPARGARASSERGASNRVALDPGGVRVSVPETGGALSPHFLVERARRFETRSERLA